MHASLGVGTLDEIAEKFSANADVDKNMRKSKNILF